MSAHRLTQSPRTPFTRKSRSASLFALIALAAPACSDTTAPAATDASPSASVAAAKPARAPYISELHLHSIYIDMGPDGTYDNGYDLTIANPGQKTDGVYFQAELQQGQYTQDGGGSALYCAAAAGVLPRGTCTMTWWVSTPVSPFVRGPARLTIRLLQNRNDTGVVLLDSLTVDVEIVHS